VNFFSSNASIYAQNIYGDFVRIDIFFKLFKLIKKWVKFQETQLENATMEDNLKNRAQASEIGS
jgi:hypothetical protein